MDDTRNQEVFHADHSPVSPTDNTAAKPESFGVVVKRAAVELPYATWGAIPSFSKDSIHWDAPSSFVLYRDGDWTLSVQRCANHYNSYGPFDRHFSVHWFWCVDYREPSGALIYRGEYKADEEGYMGATSGIVRQGNDAHFASIIGRIDRSKLTGFVRYETFY
jgi:hypothetical protein